MNISLSLRQFTVGLGAIAVAFSLDHGALAQQAQQARLPGTSITTAASIRGCASMLTAPPPVTCP